MSTVLINCRGSRAYLVPRYDSSLSRFSTSNYQRCHCNTIIPAQTRWHRCCLYVDKSFDLVCLPTKSGTGTIPRLVAKIDRNTRPVCQ